VPLTAVNYTATESKRERKRKGERKRERVRETEIVKRRNDKLAGKEWRPGDNCMPPSKVEVTGRTPSSGVLA